MKYIFLEKVTDLDAPIRKGIDAVYEFSSPPPKYIVAELEMHTNETKFLKLASLTNRQGKFLETLQEGTTKFSSRRVLPEVTTITQNTEVVVEKWIENTDELNV